MCLSCHGLCEQGLSGSRRAYKQGTLGKFCSDCCIFVRIMQKFHNLLQRFLGLILSGHILKCDTGLLLYIGFGFTLAYAHHASAFVHHTHDQAEAYYQQNHRYQKIQNSPNDRAGGIRKFLLKLNTIFLQKILQRIFISHQIGGKSDFQTFILLFFWCDGQDS